MGFVEPHGRARTAALLDGLEVVPRRRVPYRDSWFEEMDVDAVLARRPQVAVVDELAHTNVPGGRNEKRWQDVEELLAAGITVLTTLNIQHLESLNDTVERITGVAQRETIPDAVVRAADQIDLVDVAPEQLRRRLARGDIYPPERIDAALAHFFREGNLTALRELTLLWLADRVDEELLEYMARHEIRGPWETRERVVVALSGQASNAHLIRRAARMAARRGGDLLAVLVVSDDGLVGVRGEAGGRAAGTDRRPGRHLPRGGGERRAPRPAPVRPGRERHAAGPGGEHPVAARRVWCAARWWPGWCGRPAPSTCTSSPRRSRRAALLPRADAGLPPSRCAARLLGGRGGGGGPGRAHPGADRPARPPGPVDGLPPLPLPGRRDRRPGRMVAGRRRARWRPSCWSTGTSCRPCTSLNVASAENAFALAVFVLVGGVVSLLMASAARRRMEAARVGGRGRRPHPHGRGGHRGAGPAAGTRGPPPGHLRRRGRRGAAAIRARGGGSRWPPGRILRRSPGAGTTSLPLADDAVLVLRGGPRGRRGPGGARRLLAHLAAAVRSRALEEEAAVAARAASLNQLRSTILNAVSHDLRTPLSSIKAAVSSLRQTDITWSEADRGEFLATIEEEADRLNSLVGNLLDMSRLQAGALSLALRPIGLDEVVPRALRFVLRGEGQVEVDVPETLSRVKADPALLERAVANVADNALAWSPAGEAGAHRRLGGRRPGRVARRGPGARASRRRGGSASSSRSSASATARAGEGIGLGLAVAKGFVEAMGGTIELEDTPGGGLTVCISLEAA